MYVGFTRPFVHEVLAEFYRPYTTRIAQTILLVTTKISTRPLDVFTYVDVFVVQGLAAHKINEMIGELAPFRRNIFRANIDLWICRCVDSTVRMFTLTIVAVYVQGDEITKILNAAFEVALYGTVQRLMLAVQYI